MTIDPPEATNDTLVLVGAAMRAVRRLWEGGYRYSKAGMITNDLVPPAVARRVLFGGFDHELSSKTMAAMDAVNARHGRGPIVPATVGFQKGWSTKFEMRSPRYRTRWDELPTVC